jgi:hypothetical protein
MNRTIQMDGINGLGNVHRLTKERNLDDYLTISEVAVRLKLKPKTIKNKMAAGVFKKGVHYFSPAGLGPRFKWSAVIAWLECEEMPKPEESIPMARGYKLGGTSNHLTGSDIMSTRQYVRRRVSQGAGINGLQSSGAVQGN